MLQQFKNIAVVSLSTVGSRVLGLARDILIFAALGASLWNSAFILAFTLPNLFRRLLGEGALTSAVVPVFSDLLERDGRDAAFGFLNQVLLRLFIVLVGLVALGMALLAWGSGEGGWLPARWALAGELSVVLLPYMLFICTAAIVCAGLNLMGRFAVAASTPLLLNLAMIGSLAVGMARSGESEVLVRWLCGGVLAGGLLQLLLPAIDLMRQGWRPRIERRPGAELEQLWRLFLPGLLGAAVLQVNILVSRVLAYTLDESAVSVLYLASRLMELPLGVFTIAVATVFFPQLAQALSRSDAEGFAAKLCQGMRLVVAVALPAGIGLWVLGEPILQSLFQWGAFEARDVAATVPLLAIYGLGLPFYSAATFATRGLHAGKDMRSPLRVALYCLFVNAVCGLVLMQFLGAAGLALANVIAAVVQAVLLWRALSSERPELGLSRLNRSFLQALGAALAMALVCWIGLEFSGLFRLDAKPRALLEVLVLVPLGAGVYFLVLKLLRFEEMEQLAALARRFVRR